MRTYWIAGLVSKENDIREIEAMKDGLLFRIKRNDFEDILSNYPSDRNGWYFNESRDRFIAENDGPEIVICNPQLLWAAGFEITT